MLDFVPRTYALQLMVAGGYAVNPASSSDIDLWITDVPDTRLQRVRQEVLSHLRSIFPVSQIEIETSVAEIKSDGYNVMSVVKIAKVDKGDGLKPYHFLVTEMSPLEVLDSFDLSICQVGIMVASGQVLEGSFYTPITEPIDIVKVTPTTQDRLKKYESRFTFRGDGIIA